MAFVPIIPAAWPSLSNYTIVNKTIVHSDTVLNLKDLGENIKVTEVSDISKYDLKSFLNIIFENNNHVSFNTIQYSEEKNKVWIYASEKVDINCWENRNLKEYKYVDPDNLIDYMNSIINNTSCPDRYISIDKIAKYQEKKTKEFEKNKDKLITSFKSRYEKKHPYSLYIYVRDFDYKGNILKICLRKEFHDSYFNMCFKKEKDDLYLVSSTYYESDEILLNYLDIISKIYDLYKKNKSYNEERIGSIFRPKYIYNSEFSLNTYTNGFKINLLGDKLIAKSAYKTNYKFEGINSQKEITYLKENINKIVKHLYFSIDKLPTYMKNYIKQEEREKEKRRLEAEKRRLKEEEEQRLLEEKRQKKEAMIKKIIPFYKRRKKSDK